MKKATDMSSKFTEIMFPAAILTEYSKKNKTKTYLLFLLCIVLSSFFLDYFHTIFNASISRYLFSGTSFSLNEPDAKSYIFVRNIVYSPIFTMFKNFTLISVFFIIIYLFIRKHNNRSFLDFLVPLISFSYLGVFVILIFFACSYNFYSLVFAYFFVYIYGFFYFLSVLREEYKIGHVRGTIVLLFSFVVYLLCSISLVLFTHFVFFPYLFPDFYLKH